MEKLVCLLVLLATNAIIGTVVALKEKNSLNKSISFKEGVSFGERK